MNLELLKKYTFPLVLLGIITIFVFFNFTDGPLTKEDPMEDFPDLIFAEERESEGSTPPTEEPILVDVKGQVKNPGIYSLKPGDRVNDVIALAGGLREEADEIQINLAQKVFDEMVIFVPKKGESPALPETGSTSAQKVRINQASKEELTQLNGIGPSKASAIIQYREENGPFQTIEDLLNVSGIGEKTLENFKDDIQVP